MLLLFYQKLQGLQEWEVHFLCVLLEEILSISKGKRITRANPFFLKFEMWWLEISVFFLSKMRCIRFKITSFYDINSNGSYHIAQFVSKTWRICFNELKKLCFQVGLKNWLQILPKVVANQNPFQQNETQRTNLFFFDGNVLFFGWCEQEKKNALNHTFWKWLWFVSSWRV